MAYRRTFMDLGVLSIWLLVIWSFFAWNDTEQTVKLLLLSLVVSALNNGKPLFRVE